MGWMRDTLVLVTLGLIGGKVWYDIVQFVYYRERMRACTKAVEEGVGLIRFAIERGLLTSDWSTLETNANVISRAVNARVNERG